MNVFIGNKLICQSKGYKSKRLWETGCYRAEKEAELLRSREQVIEGSNSGNKREPRKKPTKASYKAAIGIYNRLVGRSSGKEDMLNCWFGPERR